MIELIQSLEVCNALDEWTLCVPFPRWGILMTTGAMLAIVLLPRVWGAILRRLR